MQLKIGLLGFGRTGSLVANEILKEPTFDLIWVLRRSSCDYRYASEKLGYKTQAGQFFSKISSSFFQDHPVDIVIDFSHSSNVKHYNHIAESGAKIVSAVSNYSEGELQEIKKVAQQTAILYSPNITLGINWLIVASKILKEIIPDADIEVVEEHFRDKKDKSGTAMKIAAHLNLNPKEHVNSIRVGGIIGKHEIIFGLPNQTIRLTHESINRAAFGRGAIFAAKKIESKGNGLYNMEQVLQKEFLNKIKNFEI